MREDFLNLILAFVFSFVILFLWNHFFPNSKVENQITQEITQKEINVNEQKEEDSDFPRVFFKTNSVFGSINLKGLRFDDLTLSDYQVTTEKNSENVKLLNSDFMNKYFLELGLISDDSSLILPNNQTTWKSDKEELSENCPVTLSYKNKQIEVKIKISVDKHYMFNIEKSITNLSDRSFKVKSYALINKSSKSINSQSKMSILHEGFIGTVNKKLEEKDYEKIKEEEKKSFYNTEINWLGITDKYWLTAIIPDSKFLYNGNYKFGNSNGDGRFQTDILSNTLEIAPQKNVQLNHKLFVGAKKLDLLDQYEEKYNIKLFDRAIDFGWFYILTKPIFYFLNFLYKYVGNFGISIMLLTVIIKIAMFSLSSKSHRSMQKIKLLAPEIENIKKLYANDKQKIHQETILLYKKEKVNPMSGCLPLILQIPVFFSIYKVLYVTIEMRHADFFGWINDLSAPDPSNIFTFFGLFDYQTPDFLHLGAWPIIMSITMFFQQMLNPKPADPTQAIFMKFLPLIFLFMFNNFPAGLLIYWSWSNVLSIIQQLYINKRSKKSL
ncbi:MAG: membrane protein insertase YidC [Rickettsia sp.]|nr:membrane protein insertase YidC [Rickettsia sp.]